MATRDKWYEMTTIRNDFSEWYEIIVVQNELSQWYEMTMVRKGYTKRRQIIRNY